MRAVRRSAVLAAALVLLGVAAVASAEDIVDFVQVGVPGRSSTKGFAPSLALVLSAPSAKYQRACCYDGSSGAWSGPEYRAEGNPNRGGSSTVGWKVSFARSAASPAALARKAPFLDAPRVAVGKVKIKHIVGGRKVGTITGAFVVVGERAPAARHQVAVVVPLSHKVKAVTLFNLATPFTDSAGQYGQYAIEGVRPSAWNRSQALLLVRRVSLEGALPPSKITVRARKGRLAGTVVDIYGHPVSEAPIKLRIRRNGAWRPSGLGSTTPRGRFAFNGISAGTYRILVTLGGSKASRTARVP